MKRLLALLAVVASAGALFASEEEDDKLCTIDGREVTLDLSIRAVDDGGQAEDIIASPEDLKGGTLRWNENTEEIWVEKSGQKTAIKFCKEDSH